METQIVWVVGGMAVIAMIYAYVTTGAINASKVDHERINELSEIIQSGSMTFLYREYRALVPFVVIVAALLWFGLNPATAICFVLGSLSSSFTGYVGMRIATKANGRTVFAAKKGMNQALNIAFKGGSVMGMTVVGVGLLGVLGVYMVFQDV